MDRVRVMWLEMRQPHNRLPDYLIQLQSAGQRCSPAHHQMPRALSSSAAAPAHGQRRRDALELNEAAESPPSPLTEASRSGAAASRRRRGWRPRSADATLNPTSGTDRRAIARRTRASVRVVNCAGGAAPPADAATPQAVATPSEGAFGSSPGATRRPSGITRRRRRSTVSRASSQNINRGHLRSVSNIRRSCCRAEQLRFTAPSGSRSASASPSYRTPFK